MQPVTIAIAGAGARGTTYARFAAERPDRARVVAVAEPRVAWRDRIAADLVFDDWRVMLDRPRLADAVVVSTQDADHVGPVLAAAAAGYHILLEKPMAPNEADCRRIVDAARDAGVILAVCHVLRYTTYTRKLKELIDGGAIGDVVSVQHLEPVGYWHQAHSYVRGNWRREDESSPMVLAKSCHDLDWIRYLVGRPCRALSSFGGLAHFRPDQAPPGAADRCLDCAVEADCPYSARRIYLGGLAAGRSEWPVAVLDPVPTPASIERALREGPYGRCVYRCDNDVVDHQVVAMQFEGGVTATFTMTGFTAFRGRTTTVFGTRGEVVGDGDTLRVHDFLTDTSTTVRPDPLPEPTALAGHGGGDYGVMDAFVRAVATGDAGAVLSGPDESLETHRMVFAAERARRSDTVVRLSVTDEAGAPSRPQRS